MRFPLMPDYALSAARYEAFFHGDMLDRPPVSIILPGAPAPRPAPKTYSSLEEKWLDVEQRALELDADVRSAKYLYDALPCVFPNLGPEVFSAWCGCGYEYGDTTTWSVPLIRDWDADADKARLDVTSPLFEKTVAFTRRMLDLSRGDYVVGMTDLHPGGDHIAALRDPQNLAIDLLERPDDVKRMLCRAMPDFFCAYGVFYRMLREAGMPITSWIPLPVEGAYGIPSNDFSCMISTDMFEEFFLPGLRQECAFYERSIYHLDGPGALRHLDALLQIDDLNAVQWVCGAGREGFSRWRDVYKKIQHAHKGLQLICHVRELDDIFHTLRPEGVWFSSIGGVTDEAMAQDVVRAISLWRMP